MADLVGWNRLAKTFGDAHAGDLPKEVGSIKQIEWHIYDLWIISSASAERWARTLHDTLAGRNPSLRLGSRQLRHSEPADTFSRMCCYLGSKKCFAFLSADLLGDPIGQMQVNYALRRHALRNTSSRPSPFLYAIPLDGPGQLYMAQRKELSFHPHGAGVAASPEEVNLLVLRDAVGVLEDGLGIREETAERSIFVSYSHRNAVWLDEMRACLADDELETTLWDDSRIAAGGEFEHEIRVNLLKSCAVVFLVTNQFLASNFIRSKEMSGALQLAEAGYLRILWVTVSQCSYKGSGVEKYHALHDPEIPLDTLAAAERKRIWAKISEIVS